MSFDWKEHLSLAEEISPDIKAKISRTIILPVVGRELYAIKKKKKKNKGQQKKKK